jgi:hypothetical protein
VLVAAPTPMVLQGSQQLVLSSREISFPCCGAVWCAAERRLGTRPPGRKQMEIRADPVRCCHVNVPVRPQTAWSLCYSIFPSVGVYLFSGFPSPPEEWFVTATSWVHAWILSITHSRDALLNGKWGKRNGVELPLMARCDPPNYTAAMCKRCEQPAAAAAPVPGRPIGFARHLFINAACGWIRRPRSLVSRVGRPRLRRSSL